MRLRFWGIGAAFNPSMGNTGAFFMRGGQLFLLDCGEQAFTKLLGAGVLSGDLEAVTVIVTHLHGDHCGSLGTLGLYVTQVLKKPLTIVHPNADIRTLLSLMGLVPDAYALLDEYRTDGLSVTAMPARHAPTVTAYSYLLTDEDGTVYYSGDNAEMPAHIAQGIETGQITRAYIDTNIFDTPPENPVHLPFDTLLSAIAPQYRSRCVLMHFNRDFRQQAEQAGFACAEADAIFRQEELC